MSSPVFPAGPLCLLFIDFTVPRGGNLSEAIPGFHTQPAKQSQKNEQSCHHQMEQGPRTKPLWPHLGCPGNCKLICAVTVKGCLEGPRVSLAPCWKPEVGIAPRQPHTLREAGKNVLPKEVREQLHRALSIVREFLAEHVATRSPYAPVLPASGGDHVIN